MTVPVLLLHPFDAFAGAQKVAATLVEVLTARGVSVRVRLGFGRTGFVSRLPTVSRFMAVDRSFLRKLLYPVWVGVSMIQAAICSARGQIVWANTIHAVPSVLLSLIFAPRRVVLHIHEIEFPWPFRILLNVAIARGATIVCVSDFQARKLGVPAQLLPNGLGWPPAPVAPSIRDRFVFVGNTKPLKGFALYLRVVERLQVRGMVAVAFLSGTRETEDPGLVSRAESIGVDLHFAVTDPATMFANGFACLLASDPSIATETFSLVAAESVWHLVPVIAAGSAVLPEICGAALAFEEPGRNPDRLAEGIEALARDPDRYARLVDACSDRRHEFEVERFGSRLEELLNTVAAR